MLHLSDERLAALADDEPNAAEADHLAVCRRCAAERVSQRRLLAMANAARDHIGPALVDWSVIANRLHNEGMLGSGGENSGRFAAAVRPAWMTASKEQATGNREPAVAIAAPTPPGSIATRRPAYLQWGMRAAAAVVLLVGGAGLGRMTAVTPTLTSTPAAATTPAPGGVTPISASAPSTGMPSDVYPMFGSVNDALKAMELAQMQYQYAASFIARNDTSTRIDDRAYRARLQALDEIAATSRAALYRAPHDPVLNQYYLSTMGAREATLQLLGNRVQGGGSRLARY